MKQLKQTGQKLEQAESIRFHQQSIPFLIHPQILRKRQAGQVDLARILKKSNVSVVELLEVKSGEGISYSQRARLKRAAEFIGVVLELPVTLKFSLRTTRE